MTGRTKKCSLSKYGFRTSGIRPGRVPTALKTGLLPRLLSSVLKRPSQEVRRERALRRAMFGCLRVRPVNRSDPKTSRKPATQRGGGSGGEHGSYGNWRNERDLTTVRTCQELCVLAMFGKMPLNRGTADQQCGGHPIVVPVRIRHRLQISGERRTKAKPRTAPRSASR